MGNYTREEILQMAEEEDVEFIRLQFTDMFGTLKNIAITARELPRALDNRCIVDGSFIAGIAGESEPDSLEDYSGQFKLRIPRSLHRLLAEHSQREGISMNQYCVYLLSRNDAVFSK